MSIAELIKRQTIFYIPSYQRGYRWKSRQVNQLIDDINAFIPTENNRFYFLQALAVAKDDTNGRVNVVDGQQRLTTLNLILGGKDSGIIIEYAREADKALDQYFKEIAKATIDERLGELGSLRRNAFCKKVEAYCKFLYYEVDITKELSTFNELNSGKIPAKDSELVKCVMLTIGNDEATEITNARANEWDIFERRINDQGFFAFITPRNTWRENDKMTVLFRYAGIMPSKIEQEEEVFPFLTNVLKLLETVSRSTVWKRICSAYYRLAEWYNDPLMYHAFGTVVHCRANSKEIPSVTGGFQMTSAIEGIAQYKYKVDNDDYKNWGTGLFNYLLLSNTAFCWKRWPNRYNFVKHRKVEVWTMEHIFARNQKDLNDDELKEWLGDGYSKDKSDSYKDECKNGKGDEWLEKELGSRYPSSEDNSIRNLALLPRDSNSSLNNKLFDGKRKEISNWANNRWQTYWAPPVTEAIFMKSVIGTKMTIPYWSEEDKEAYLTSIENDIREFIDALKKNERI